jgi:hypothetical protein
MKNFVSNGNENLGRWREMHVWKERSHFGNEENMEIVSDFLFISSRKFLYLNKVDGFLHM